MFLEVQNINSASEALYPLVASEVYLPDCTEVEVKSIVCLRLDRTASNPLLILPESVESTDIFLTNTEFSTRAVFGELFPAGLFSCSSAEDHVISAVVATGETHAFMANHASCSRAFAKSLRVSLVRIPPRAALFGVITPVCYSLSESAVPQQNCLLAFVLCCSPTELHWWLSRESSCFE